MVQGACQAQLVRDAANTYPLSQYKPTTLSFRAVTHFGFLSTLYFPPFAILLASTLATCRSPIWLALSVALDVHLLTQIHPVPSPVR